MVDYDAEAVANVKREGAFYHYPQYAFGVKRTVEEAAEDVAKIVKNNLERMFDTTGKYDIDLSEIF